MEKENLKASCPVCGRNLFRGTEDSQLEGCCPKCGTYLKINYFKDGVRVEVVAEAPKKQNNKE